MVNMRAKTLLIFAAFAAILPLILAQSECENTCFTLPTGQLGCAIRDVVAPIPNLCKRKHYNYNEPYFVWSIIT